jgi:cytoskeletal protein CcmA (bactofilin family)
MWTRKMKKLSPNSTDTLIGEGTVVEGKLLTKASVRIEGQVHGDIECLGDVIVGEKGMAHSNLFARNVVNAGVIQGSITVKEKLAITKTGKVYGNIQVPSLHIAEGGLFEGVSHMDPKANQERKAEREDRPHSGKSDKIAAVK